MMFENEYAKRVLKYAVVFAVLVLGVAVATSYIS